MILSGKSYLSIAILLKRTKVLIMPNRFYYFWPFYLLSSLYNAWREHRDRKRIRVERIRRILEREDRGLPPGEEWEAWR